MLNISRDYEEKRNFVRVKVATPVLFTLSQHSEKHEAQCLDLSGSGLLIETTKKLTRGDQLQVTIPPTRPQQLPFKALVEVIRVELQSDRHTYLTGAAIKKVIQ